MTRKTLPSATEYKLKAKSFAYVAKCILAGLAAGHSVFDWGTGEWSAYRDKAKKMGFTLISKTSAKRLGYTLKPKAKPIGTAAMGKSRMIGDVYILECHFVPPPVSVESTVNPRINQ